MYYRGAREGYRPSTISLAHSRPGARRLWSPRGVSAKKHVHAAAAMCWRQVSRKQKTLLIILVYFVIYNIISYAMEPESSFTFVRHDLKVGDKYAFLFLADDRRAPVFSDAEGWDVFKTRRCGNCFLTNNKGFLPLSEYDAILIRGEKNLLSKTSAFMDPQKRFLIETSARCVNNKLTKCFTEPKITSFSTSQSYNLCEICEFLQKKRLTRMD